MFYSLTGKVVYTDESTIAVECSGVAFSLTASANTLRKCGETGSVQTLYTYLSVREDALDLFGFADKSELDCFKMLIGITGVGPKAAIAILSALTPDALALAVASEDAKAITAAQGIGGKIAGRIVLELKGKIDTLPLSGDTTGKVADIKKSGITYAGEEAVNALVSLGFSRTEAGVAVGKLDGNLSTEEMIKRALTMLAGKM
ncbi:MAG: Holliday junction branch migration protein RuvA [Clostridia bacterium]|nr:Holliday junction branch migration protein RuvA [Clostridia bacterium]